MIDLVTFVNEFAASQLFAAQLSAVVPPAPLIPGAVLGVTVPDPLHCDECDEAAEYSRQCWCCWPPKFCCPSHRVMTVDGPTCFDCVRESVYEDAGSNPATSDNGVYQ